MVVGQYDVRLNGDRMPILIQMNTFSLQEEVTITSPDVLVKVLNQFPFIFIFPSNVLSIENTIASAFGLCIFKSIFLFGM